jgi:hypothetical protein
MVEMLVTVIAILLRSEMQESDFVSMVLLSNLALAQWLYIAS